MLCRPGGSCRYFALRNQATDRYSLMLPPASNCSYTVGQVSVPANTTVPAAIVPSWELTETSLRAAISQNKESDCPASVVSIRQ